MSLEEALNKNTETMERLINVLSLKIKDEVNDTPKETKVEKTATTKAKAAAPKKAKAPAKAKDPVVEKVDDASLFNEEGAVVGTVEATSETVPQGSAPVSEGSEWYIYTMARCNLLSATTGDPAATMAICADKGVTDLATPDIDHLLYEISEVINAKLKELGVE